jgi:hypothetical protein
MKLTGDLSAKLLATENITVVRSRVRTASFDIKSRVLTLPNWKDMTPEIDDMLRGHEVGHALFTDESYIEPIMENRKIASYLNVIEDVRIEKLLKRKYPGIRKSMNEGYRQLNEKDFFGVSKIPNLEMLNLIDRINLYYKAGYSCGVTFSSEEKLFVVRAEKTETVDEVIALANDIYAFSKEQAEKRRKEAQETPEDLEDLEEYDGDDADDVDDFEDEDDYIDSNEDSDSADAQEPDDKKQAGSGRSKQSKEEREEQEIEKELESQTEKNFTEKLEELADENTEYRYYTLDEKYEFDPIISFKTILTETKEVEEMLAERPQSKKDYEQFMTESGRVVSYLLKEFEMRKSATLYKRAQTSKIGSLDMKKVWSYKLNDDLFKRIMTLPQGKNHGMIFLLDWSGSMDPVLEDTIKQVINLAMFCQRAQIPYQVFAFTSQYDVLKGYEQESKMHARNKEFHNQPGMLSNAVSKFGLLEFFSSKMSNVEFNTMVRRILQPRLLNRVNAGDYSTGGTPLNEALGYMVGYLAKFSKANNVEKMSFITLTDGDGSALHSSQHYSLDEHRYDRSSYEHKKIQLRHFLQDPVTKNTYQLFKHGNSHTEAILRMIKSRYDINVVGFYICRNMRRDLESAVHSNLPGFNGNAYAMVDIMRRDFRDKGFSSIKNTGRDELFIVPQNKLIVEEGELVVDEKQNARQIAKNFGKMLSGRKTSRVLLNQFIGYVA